MTTLAHINEAGRAKGIPAKFADVISRIEWVSGAASVHKASVHQTLSGPNVEVNSYSMIDLDTAELEQFVRDEARRPNPSYR